LDEFALSGPVAFGSFGVQVFRTSGQTKEQEKTGNGTWVMQHTEQSVKDRGRRPARLATTLRCFSPLPARPRPPATSAGSGRTGRIRRSRMAYSPSSPGWMPAGRKRLAELRDRDPESPEVQAEVANHYRYIRRFWGTAGSPDNQKQQYVGLGELYEADSRYTTIDGVEQPGFGEFMSKAMRSFAGQHLE